MDEDRYPGQSGRRRFVKSMVGAGALASVGTGASAAFSVATDNTGGTGGPTDFVGIENVDGPAPRGMPIVPLTIESALTAPGFAVIAYSLYRDE